MRKERRPVGYEKSHGAPPERDSHPPRDARTLFRKLTPTESPDRFVYSAGREPMPPGREGSRDPPSCKCIRAFRSRLPPVRSSTGRRSEKQTSGPGPAGPEPQGFFPSRSALSYSFRAAATTLRKALRTPSCFPGSIPEKGRACTLTERSRTETVRSVYPSSKRFFGNAPGVAADWVGVDVPDRYVFGFGMDFHEQGRNLPAIYALKES